MNRYEGMPVVLFGKAYTWERDGKGGWTLAKVPTPSIAEQESDADLQAALTELLGPAPTEGPS